MFHRLNYELSQSKTTVASTTATSSYRRGGKTRLRSSLKYVLSKDTRDSRFDPTEGYYLEMDETLAGFGGDVKFLRTKLSAAYYKPLLFKSVILGVSGKLGYVTGLGDKVTQSQRFNLGGRDVRGFGSGGIGPRDTGSSDAVGGNKMYAGSFEVVSNLGFDKDTGVRWTVFTDFGSLWGTDYPSGVTKPNAAKCGVSAGVGIFWSTAIGPLSFSWAKPLSKMAHDSAKNLPVQHRNQAIGMMKKTRFTPIGLLICMMAFVGFAPASFAQTDATAPAAEKSMEVKRIALVDLDGVLRAADANNRIRELLDGQRAKFQDEFRAIEVDLQQSERDLLAKRELMAKRGI